jgi:transcriptional regulator with XRE-family HTH domain
MEKNNQKVGAIPQKMTFRCYYDTLGDRKVVAPKRDFVEKIAKMLKVSTKTVRGYIAGSYQPDALRKEILSKYLGIPEDELFPVKEDKEA